MEPPQLGFRRAHGPGRILHPGIHHFIREESRVRRRFATVVLIPATRQGPEARNGIHQYGDSEKPVQLGNRPSHARFLCAIGGHGSPSLQRIEHPCRPDVYGPVKAMSFSAALLETLRPMFPRRADLHIREVMADNLVFSYHTICASEPMLRECALNLDPSSPFLSYFVHHLAEEKNHVFWLRRDLANADISIINRRLQFDAAELAGPQYYLIRHVSPLAVLGYLAVLECFPMDPVILDALESIHGKEMFHTLRYHSEHDPEHGADVLEQIDKVAPEMQPVIAENAIRTVSKLVRTARTFGSSTERQPS